MNSTAIDRSSARDFDARPLLDEVTLASAWLIIGALAAMVLGFGYYLQ
ncbi:MAG TPA: hypothetical protein VMG32_05170 [Anaeromyxobacteraceae bacterium]|nr:hypothetical protein [Anaeromyxobacteraceae bacterium]